MTHVIKTVAAFQGHAVPDRIMPEYGPFPAELFEQPPVNYNYEQAYAEDGDNFELGATVQNNFTPLRWLKCFDCEERVREDDIDNHDCGIYDVTEAYIEAQAADDDDEEYADED